MKIIEAIKHCEEVAKQNETDAILYKNCKEIKANMYEKLTAEKAENDCRECAAEHRQLAEWLTELKDLREEYAYISKVSYGYYKELKEAKQLLKMAVEDLDSIYCKLGDNCEPMPDCGECPYIPSNQGCYCKWRYVDIALKLIGDESNK